MEPNADTKMKKTSITYYRGKIKSSIQEKSSKQNPEQRRWGDVPRLKHRTGKQTQNWERSRDDLTRESREHRD